jgi:hypothetical protein
LLSLKDAHRTYQQIGRVTDYLTSEDERDAYLVALDLLKKSVDAEGVPGATPTGRKP